MIKCFPWGSDKDVFEDSFNEFHYASRIRYRYRGHGGDWSRLKFMAFTVENARSLCAWIDADGPNKRQLKNVTVEFDYSAFEFKTLKGKDGEKFSYVSERKSSLNYPDFLFFNTSEQCAKEFVPAVEKLVNLRKNADVFNIPKDKA